MAADGEHDGAACRRHRVEGLPQRAQTGDYVEVAAAAAGGMGAEALGPRERWDLGKRRESE